MKQRWLFLIFTVIVLAGVISIAFLRHRVTPQAAQAVPKSGQSNQSVLPSQQPSILSFQGLTDNQPASGMVQIAVNTEGTASFQKIAYYIDDVFAGVAYGTPFSFNLDTTTLANGSHSIEARGYDSRGTEISTKMLIIIVGNTTVTQAANSSASFFAKHAVTATIAPATSSSSPSSSSSSASPDTQPPSTPANLMLTANDGYTTNLSWTASSDIIGVSGYKIYRDGSQIGTTSSVSYQDQTVVPGNTYHYAVAAYDAAGNLSAQSANPFITLASTSVWVDGDTPQTFASAGSGTELGVKFRALADGKVTGIRFYKGALNTGSHVGHLWSSSGTELAQATFSGETATGWQDVHFASPVSVTAGTTYTASYFAPNDGYGYTSNYFTSAGITSQYLTAMANGVDGGQGVFATTDSFPSSSFNQTNYWVDVDFAPNPNATGPAVKLADNSSVFAGYPGSNNTGLATGTRLPKRDREIDVYAAGTTVQNIEADQAIKVFANNVTIKNVRVTTAGVPGGFSSGISQAASVNGLTIQDSDIFGDGINQMQYGIKDDGSGMTIGRVNIHTVSDGIQANDTETVADSFVHDLFFFAGDHNDSFITTGGNNITLNHNTLLNPISQTAAVGLFCDFSPVTNTTVNNNLLAGGGYTVYGAGGGSGCVGSNHIVITNNRFSKRFFPTSGFFGTDTNYNPALTGNQWAGNVWYEDGTTVSP